MNGYSAFSYKAGNSVFHRMPAWIKLLFIPVFNIVIFSLDWRVAAFFALLQLVVFLFVRFSFREQLADLTPVLWYGFFLYLIGTGSLWFALAGESGLWPAFLQAVKTAFCDISTFEHLIKFTACCQIAGLMFKTSTSLELREGIEVIEMAVRRFLPCKKEPRFALVVSLFINFIPAVFKLWNQIKKAWYARGGRAGVKMYVVLFPVLFGTGLKYASNAAKALLVRESR